MVPPLCSEIQSVAGRYTHKYHQSCGQHNNVFAAAQTWTRWVLGQVGNSRPEATDTSLCQRYKVQHSPLHAHRQAVSLPAVCPHLDQTAVSQPGAASVLPIPLCSMPSSQEVPFRKGNNREFCHEAFQPCHEALSRPKASRSPQRGGLAGEHVM